MERSRVWRMLRVQRLRHQAQYLLVPQRARCLLLVPQRARRLMPLARSSSMALAMAQPVRRLTSTGPRPPLWHPRMQLVAPLSTRRVTPHPSPATSYHASVPRRARLALGATLRQMQRRLCASPPLFLHASTTPSAPPHFMISKTNIPPTALPSKTLPQPQLLQGLHS